MALVRASMPIGIIVRRTPGVTRWAAWAWRVVGVLPGAGPANWRELRRAGEAVEYHAATLPLDLWSTETEAYRVALGARVPGLVVVLHEDREAGARMPFRPAFVTASAYEGQDFCDSGDGLIENVPMPLGVIAWVRDFVREHHSETPFIKRQRDRVQLDRVEDGRGDPRIRQMADVYRAPRGPGQGRPT